MEEETRTKAADLAARATSLQGEIDFYRETATAYEKRAKRLCLVALVFILLALVVAVLLLTLALLARYGIVGALPRTVLIGTAVLALVLLLCGLLFFGMRRDERDLAAECLGKADRQQKQLDEVLAEIEEERRRNATPPTVEVLPPMKRTVGQKLTHALRVTSAVLEALSLPISALAALKKGKKKKR